MKHSTEVEQGNKVIREFMEHGGLSIRYEYHKDWRLLMSVVEKIGGLYDGKNISMWKLKEANIVLFDLGIFATKEILWLAVIEFLNWYNQNKQNEYKKG